jgi:hypothetical protein
MIFNVDGKMNWQSGAALQGQPTQRQTMGPPPLVETSGQRPIEIGRNPRADGTYDSKNCEDNKTSDESIFDGRDAGFAGGKPDEQILHGKKPLVVRGTPSNGCGAPICNERERLLWPALSG